MQRQLRCDLIHFGSVLVLLLFLQPRLLGAQETARASSSAQKEALVKNTMEQIAKDLADVNAQLLKASQPGAESAGHPGSAAKSSFPMPLAYFSDQYTGYAEPSADAKETIPFSVGESAKILARNGDWYLVTNAQDRVGWVPGAFLSQVSISDDAFQKAIAAAMRMLANMKDKYDKGPVVIKGFSIDVKIPPGVSVEFEFK